MTVAHASSFISRLGSDPSSRRAQDVRQEDPRSPSGLISTMSPAAVTQTPSAPCGTPSGGAGGGCHDTSHCCPPTRIRACSPSAATGYAPHPSPLGAGRARSLTIVIRSAFPVSRSPQPRDLRRKTAGTSPASVLRDHHFRLWARCGISALEVAGAPDQQWADRARPASIHVARRMRSAGSTPPPWTTP